MLLRCLRGQENIYSTHTKAQSPYVGSMLSATRLAIGGRFLSSSTGAGRPDESVLGHDACNMPQKTFARLLQLVSLDRRESSIRKMAVLPNDPEVLPSPTHSKEDAFGTAARQLPAGHRKGAPNSATKIPECFHLKPRIDPEPK